jgi:hypothetical protein
MRKPLTLLALLCLCTPAFAGSSDQEALKKRLQFLEIKDNNDLYVGQGSATLKDQGDWDKAELAATAAARAALAEGIEVRIQSEITDKMEGGAQGVTESTSALTKSQSDLTLANVQTKALRDFPSDGTVTVLAYLSKVQYRRQLAGKSVAIYRPEFGLKVSVWGWALPGIEKIEDSGTINGPPTDALVAGNGSGGSGNGSSIAPGYGLEFVWRDFSLGLDYYRKDLALYIYDPSRDRYDVKGDGIEVDSATLGWQYIPWNWRVQPFIPLGVSVAHVALFQSNAMATAASAGLGVRYWPSDAFSFEISARYYQGLSTADLGVLIRKDQPASLSLSGPQGRAAIQWSGF